MNLYVPVAFPPNMLTLQCFLMLSSGEFGCKHILGQFSKKSIFLAWIFFRICILLYMYESIRWLMLCIWYLFLRMASFGFLESKAILTDLSFFTVITTELMNSSFEQFSSFIICLSSINFLSSFLTFPRRCRGTRRPLC